MSKFVATDLDFNQNEIQNAVEQNLATAPSNPKEGQKYWNTAQKKLFIYDGNKWVDATNQGKTYMFTDGLTEEEGTDVVTLDLATSSSIGGVIVGNNIDVDDTATISVKDATNTQKGVIQIATDEEVATGTDTTKAINPLQLNNAVKDKITKKDLSATAPIKYNNSTGVISADIDNTPTTDSTKLVSSGGVKAELDKKVDANANITGGTHTKITYDSKGLVTKGENLTADDIPDISATYIKQSDKGVAGGVATLGSDGKVPAGQLPSFVDDVVDTYIVGDTALASDWLSTIAGGSALTPETGKIYVILTEGEYLNKTYRWSGTTYVEISASPAQATESVAGIAKLATEAQAKAGTDDTTIVTPKKLEATLVQETSKNRTLTNKTINADNNTISNLQTSNFKSGVIQTTVRDTSSATNTNLVSEKAVATALSAKVEKLIATNPLLTPSGGVCTWMIANSLNTDDVVVMIKDTSTGEEVICEVIADSGNVTIKMNATENIALGKYKAIIIG